MKTCYSMVPKKSLHNQFSLAPPLESTRITSSKNQEVRAKNQGVELSTKRALIWAMKIEVGFEMTELR